MVQRDSGLFLARVGRKKKRLSSRASSSCGDASVGASSFQRPQKSNKDVEPQRRESSGFKNRRPPFEPPGIRSSPVGIAPPRQGFVMKAVITRPGLARPQLHIDFGQQRPAWPTARCYQSDPDDTENIRQGQRLGLLARACVCVGSQQSELKGCYLCNEESRSKRKMKIDSSDVQRKESQTSSEPTLGTSKAPLPDIVKMHSHFPALGTFL